MQPEAIPTTQDAARFRCEGHWTDRSLVEFFDAAVARHPDKIAVIDPLGRRLSYGEMAKMVDVLAANLAARGIGAGDVIAIQLPNWAETATIHMAASRLGAITNPLLPIYRQKELSYILKFAKTAAVFIPNMYRNFDFPAMYGEMRSKLPDLRHVFVVDDNPPPDCEAFSELEKPCAKVADHAARGDDVTALIFTSGTESTPKGVMHSHNTSMYSTLTMAKLVGLNADDVIWMASPVGHGTGFIWGIRQAITLGATLVLQDIWDVEEALRLIEAEHCSFTLSATPFVAMLLESPNLSSRDLSSFRIFACAGAPIPEQVGMAAKTKIGCQLIGMWGMSECYVGTASSPDQPEEKLCNTDGRAMPGCEAAIYDETRTEQLAVGEVGELATRGPHVALGYFNDPERTKSAFSAGGWLFTNDLATLDGDGFVRIVGRKKDIINRGGLKVSAREIEELLLKHPSIIQVALVPISDTRLGEKSCAYVVTRDGQDLAFSDMTAHLAAADIAKYKYPEHLVVLDELPMTPSGKIQKFKLVEMFAAAAAH
ncbi:MAG: AMP-binding protein [Rhodospirillaceae bacterium]|jgi:cyclohexanecarboxylate-CoA ligase|nr:AMP-binding protein [Rhodospirillaceae bacterium]MBT3495423.1 AMP-binding protein [Rhodospirillaceae bacterium]MBT3780147.1 AMP-binding protein [Rhodospirillaceae bacterium]MBT3975534.1 AMP-binding protein [Rhodospirillaceae bacterium]MBT4168015.1 AMP-binding protein [Rhodospirillaceae bacterium]